MSEKTKIEWCDHTHNPWRGCAKVSPGCQHCYAEGWGKRFGLEWGPGKPRARASDTYLRQPMRWNAAAGLDGVRRRVFCGSLMDWLDPRASPHTGECLADLIDTIRKTPNLDWLLLSKRPEKWRTRIHLAMEWWAGKDGETYSLMADWVEGKPPSNVWLGVSAEDQERWDERVPVLLSIPARKRFVSVEPMLGPIDMQLSRCDDLDWIILGGESGPKARPCSVEWIRSGVQQCHEAAVACFVKQLGAWPMQYVSPDGYDVRLRLNSRKGDVPAEWPDGLRVREWPGRDSRT